MTDEQLASPGRHPELGSAQLRHLLAASAVRDLGHVYQVSRVMAKRYTSQGGVWTEYLVVLGQSTPAFLK